MPYRVTMLSIGLWSQRLGRSFHYQDYRRYWLGCMLATTAFHMQSIVLGWQMLEATGSAFWVGLVAFGYGLPFLILSPFTGVVADRMRRQRVMAVALFHACLFSAGLASLTAFRQVLPWQIVLASFLLGSSFVLYAPARSALLPNLVPGEMLLNASTITYSSTRLMGFFSTALAGVLVEFTGEWPTLTIQAILFSLAIPAFQRTKTNQADSVQSKPRPGHILHAVRDVAAYLRHDQPSLLALVLLSLVVVSIFTSFEKLMPVFVQSVLAAGASTFGLMVGIFSFGIALTGFAMAAGGDTVPKGQAVVLSSVLSGCGLIVSAFVRSVELALGLLLLLGVIVGIYLTLTTVLFESRPLDSVRGRVQSVWGMVWGVAPFVNLAAGAIAEQWGVTFTIAVGGAVGVILCLAIGLIGASLREL